MPVALGMTLDLEDAQWELLECGMRRLGIQFVSG
jgi:hypothetical protein